MQHILILEDETPAYQKLLRMLESLLENSIQCQWAKSNQEAITLLNGAWQPDLIMADIHLKDGVSFDVFSQVSISCPIIFCTAHHNYLQEAFQTNGIAYILKPYTQEDLQAALNKYHVLFRQNVTLNKYIVDSLKQAMHQQDEVVYKTRFAIKNPNKNIHILSVADIVLIEANGDFSKFYTQEGKTFLYSENIGNIFNKLNPAHFFKVNRSQVVQLQFIETIETYFKNRLLLTVKGYSEKVTTSSGR